MFRTVGSRLRKPLSSYTMTSKSALRKLDDLIAEIENSVRAFGTVDAPAPPAPAPAPAPATKKEKDAAKPANPPRVSPKEEAKPEVINVNSIDLRVGIIRKVARHETAEKLYVEEIDVGEEAPRAIASGLVPYYSLEQMQDRKLIVVCNLKPRNLVGFKSHGMVLCASSVDEKGDTVVEFVDPPADSQPGDRISAETLTNEPLAVNRCDKVKAWDTVAPDLRVNEEGVAYWKDLKLVTKSGAISRAPTVRNSLIR